MPTVRTSRIPPAASQHAPDLYQRLLTERIRAERQSRRVALIGCIPGCVMVYGIAHFFGTIALAVTGAAGGNDTNLWIAYTVTVVLLMAGALIGLLLVARWLIRKSFAKVYNKIWRELWQTNFMVLVVDDAYTGVIRERTEHQFALKWLCPPSPRTLEDQLDYAACFRIVLRRMMTRDSRKATGPLWEGAIGWSAGHWIGCACGCLSLAVLNWGGFALWLLGAIYYLQRKAAVAAFCDFLLYDRQTGRVVSPKLHSAVSAATGGEDAP